MVTSTTSYGRRQRVDEEDAHGEQVECEERITEALGAQATAVIKPIEVGPQALEPVPIRRCYARIHYSAQIAACRQTRACANISSLLAAVVTTQRESSPRGSGY